MIEFVHVITTVSSQAEAERIATALLEQRLAACVQIVGPIVSSYWWQGKIERAGEWLCIVKSERALFHQIEETIKALHSYKVPEIVAVPISAGSDEYLQWLREQVRKERS